jgi:hypothetical protein
MFLPLLPAKKDLLKSIQVLPDFQHLDNKWSLQQHEHASENFTTAMQPPNSPAFHIDYIRIFSIQPK